MCFFWKLYQGHSDVFLPGVSQIRLNCSLYLSVCLMTARSFWLNHFETYRLEYLDAFFLADISRNGSNDVMQILLPDILVMFHDWGSDFSPNCWKCSTKTFWTCDGLIFLKMFHEEGFEILRPDICDNPRVHVQTLLPDMFQKNPWMIFWNLVSWNVWKISMKTFWTCDVLKDFEILRPDICDKIHGRMFKHYFLICFKKPVKNILKFCFLKCLKDFLENFLNMWRPDMFEELP